MPRHHIYMKQKTLDGIREIVDKRLAEGASTAEVNMSSVGAELLEIGLRVTQAKEKKEAEQNSNDEGLTQDELFKKRLLEECMKARLSVQGVFEMMFSLEEIKIDSRYNYEKLKEKYINDCQSTLKDYFPRESK